MFKWDSFLVCLCTALVLWLTRIEACDLHGLQGCLYFDEMKIPTNILKFIPETEFLDTCERRRIYLSCAKKRIAGCDYTAVVTLYAQDNVRQVVCQDKADAYRRSGECFGQDMLSDDIISCVDEFNRAREDHCDALDYARHCARDKVERSSNCDKTHVKLMGKIVDHYLKAFAQIYTCDMPTVEGEEEEEMAETKEAATSVTLVTSATPRSNTTTVKTTTKKVTTMMTTTTESGTSGLWQQFPTLWAVLIIILSTIC